MNEAITEARKAAGLKQWQLAELLGIREDTFSRKLRHNLAPEETDRILQIINEYQKEATHHE